MSEPTLVAAPDCGIRGRLAPELAPADWGGGRAGTALSHAAAADNEPVNKGTRSWRQADRMLGGTDRLDEHDLGLLAETMRMTPEQRIDRLVDLQRLVEDMQAAVRGARPDAP